MYTSIPEDGNVRRKGGYMVVQKESENGGGVIGLQYPRSSRGKIKVCLWSYSDGLDEHDDSDANHWRGMEAMNSHRQRWKGFEV